jgi:hypothetical protein
MHALSRHADCAYSVEDLMETNPKPTIVSTTGNAIKEEALRKFETSFIERLMFAVLNDAIRCSRLILIRR